MLCTQHTVGAKTGGFLCNSNPAANSCSGRFTSSSLTSTFAALGITVLYYAEINSASSTYTADLNTAMATMASLDIDLLSISDYKALCIDAPNAAAGVGWTPRGMYLMVCISDPVVLDTMGSNLWYAGSYDAWDSNGTYTSGTGTANQDFKNDFMAQYHVAPVLGGAASYAAGEILQMAIEKCNCMDAPTLNMTIATGSWSTILSATALTFPANFYHLAKGPYITTQYASTSTPSLSTITKTSELKYPMPSWASRSKALTSIRDIFFKYLLPR